MSDLVEDLRDLRDDYAAGKWRQADRTQGMLSLAADELERLHAENERLRDLMRELADWFEAYPVDVFPPMRGSYKNKDGDYDTDEKRGLITRASAAMARHMIERVPEKIKQALSDRQDNE